MSGWRMVAVLLCWLAAAPAMADPVDDAAAAYGRGEFAQVCTLIDDYLRQPLGKPPARVALAAYYRGLASTTIAERERYLLQASAGNALDPELRAAALVHLIRLALLRGEYQRAALWGERVVSDFSATAAAADAAYYAALAQLRQGRAAEAAALLRTLAQRHPGLTGLDRAEAALAQALMDERRWTDAVATLHNLIIGYPGSNYRSWTYFNLGECHRRLNDAAQAAIAYRQVVERFPESLEAPRARAALAELAGTAAPPGPAVRPAPAATGDWTVQVAAFPQRARADELARQLTAAGWIPVDIQSAQVNGATWYRVRAGRLQTRAQAEEQRLALQRAGHNGFVARW